MIGTIRLGPVELLDQRHELEVPGEGVGFCLVCGPDRSAGAAVVPQVDIDDDLHGDSLLRPGTDVPREAP